MNRLLTCSGVALLLLVLAHAHVTADPPPEDDPCAQNKWLTWSPTDCQNNAISLASYQNKKVFVIVFTPSNEDSCKLVRKAAKYCREHPNATGKVLAFCSDDTGCDAVKLHIRQEEWSKRVKAWNTEQAVAQATAEAAGESYSPPPMPDFLKQIKDEMATANGLAALIAYHLPFKTCTRCKGMWEWLVKRMTLPEGAPRVLKFNAQGALLNEWPELGDNPNPLAGD